LVISGTSEDRRLKIEDVIEFEGFYIHFIVDIVNVVIVGKIWDSTPYFNGE